MSDVSIVKRKTIPVKKGHGHQGQQASLAISSEGYRAWGFGSSIQEADSAASKKVDELVANLKKPLTTKERCLAAFGMRQYIKNRAAHPEEINKWQSKVYSSLQSECRFGSTIDWGGLLEEINGLCEKESIAGF